MMGAGGAKGRFRVTICQSQNIGKRTLEEISSFLRSHGIASYVLAHRHGKGRKKAHWKQVWNLWITEQRSIVKYIEGVFPYLRIKKQLAEDYRRICILTNSLKGLTTPQIKIRRDVFFRLMESGVPLTEIAAMYGMDYSSLWKKAKIFGFKVLTTEESNRQRAKVPFEQLLEDYNRLGSYQAVARLYRCPSFNVRTRLIKNGVTPNAPGITRGNKRAILTA